ncbi:MAG: hypothetical protein H6Q25_268 [Bacteroidetes bacterium]|nr:hypothetical protein [Bacteroidota bacterium]
MNFLRKLELFLLGFCLIGITSCSQKQEKIIFSGELTHVNQEKIYLYKVAPEGSFLIDSAIIKDGKFTLTDFVDKNSEKKDYPGYYKVFLTKTNHILTIAHIGEHLHFKANADSLVKTYSVTGGLDAQLINQLDMKLKSFIDSVNNLTLIYDSNQYNDSVKEDIETMYNQYVLNHQNFLKDFIHKNGSSIATLNAFYQKFNRLTFLPEKDHVDLLKEMYRVLYAKYPDNSNVFYIKSKIDKYSTE